MCRLVGTSWDMTESFKCVYRAYLGYSAIEIARHLPSDGKLISVGNVVDR